MAFDLGSMFGGGLLGETSGYSTHRIFGSKPKVAKPTQVELPESQKQAIQANIESFPSLSKLSDLYTNEELDQLSNILGPQYRDIISQGVGTTGKLYDLSNQYLSGEVPQDVQDAIQRSTAYQSLAGGFGGSPMANALTARDLGLTSLDLQQRGAALAGQAGNSAQLWDTLARRNMLDPSSMFITPGAQQAALENYYLQKQAAKQAAYNVRAQPDPTQAGIYNTIGSLIGSVLSIYGGRGGNAFNQGGGYGGAQGGGGFSSLLGGFGGGGYGGGYYGSPVFNQGYAYGTPSQLGYTQGPGSVGII